ncbi:protein of unknown function [Pararobbsia alpina]
MPLASLVVLPDPRAQVMLTDALAKAFPVAAVPDIVTGAVEVPLLAVPPPLPPPPHDASSNTLAIHSDARCRATAVSATEA